MKFGGQPTPWSEVEIEGLRLRSVSQILIQEIGAAGPENAEESARRACGVIQRMADQIVSADARIAELERDAARYRYLARLMRGEPELMGDAYGFRWALPDGILSDRTTLAAAIDEARAGNGGEG